MTTMTIMTKRGTLVLRMAACAALALGLLGPGCDGTGTSGYPPPRGPDTGGGGAVQATGSGGTVGTGTASTTADASAEHLCGSTGGTQIGQSCCPSVGPWADTCAARECGSSAQCEAGAPVPTPMCDCGLGRCFDPTQGCVKAP